MPKAALIVIGIVYGISLAVAYIAHHPPTWVPEISVTAGGARTFRVLGHEVSLRVDVKRTSPDEGPACVPPEIHLPVLRDNRAWHGATGEVTDRPSTGACR
jgi:hypothetical protein